MYMYIYNDKKLVFDNSMDEFMDLSEEDQVTYINNLQNIKNDLNYGIVDVDYINDINSSVNSFTLKKKNNDTLNKISGIYLKDYIENINKKNAIVYNEYLRHYSKFNPKS